MPMRRLVKDPGDGPSGAPEQPLQRRRQPLQVPPWDELADHRDGLAVLQQRDTAQARRGLYREDAHSRATVCTTSV